MENFWQHLAQSGLGTADHQPVIGGGKLTNKVKLCSSFVSFVSLGEHLSFKYWEFNVYEVIYYISIYF